MRRHVVILFTAGLMALIPSGAAAFTDVREYTADAINFSDADGVVAATSFTYPSSPHGYTVSARRTIVEWTSGITSAGPSIVGTDAYTIALNIRDGSAVIQITCSYQFSRDNTLSGRIQFYDTLPCDGTALEPGTGYTYETTVTMGAGTNKISEASYGLRFTQTDTVTDTTLDALATTATLVSQHEATRTLVNETTQSLGDDLSGVAVFLSMRIAQSEANLTTLFQDFTCDNCNITQEFEPFSIVELPGFTGEQVGALLLFLVLLLIAYWQRWLFVAIACIIGTLDLMFRDANGPAPIFGFEFTFLLLILGISMQLVWDMRDAWRERDKQEPEN